MRPSAATPSSARRYASDASIAGLYTLYPMLYLLVYLLYPILHLPDTATLLEVIEAQAQTLLKLCREAIAAGIERYEVTWALSEQGWRRMSREEREFHQDAKRSVARTVP